MTEPKIVATGVAKEFRTNKALVRALEPFNLSIEEGEFVCILGPSGCGKSTFLRIVAGLVAPSAGAVRIDGRRITEPGPERGLVFQEYALFPWMTVLKNVMYGPIVRGIAAKMSEKIAREQIARVGLVGFEHHFPRQLSGGMKQRVGIARVWANQPDVLLMDEPFGALDSITRGVLQRDLLKLWLEERKTVIFVTHSVEEAIYLADRVVVMRHGPDASRRSCPSRRRAPATSWHRNRSTCGASLPGSWKSRCWPPDRSTGTPALMRTELGSGSGQSLVPARSRPRPGA